MPNGPLAQVVKAISDDVVARLAAAGYPPLCPMPDGSPGKILVGPERIFEQNAPPRIIFVPTGHKYETRDTYSREQATGGPERRAQKQQRTIATDIVMVDVRCWGQDPDAEDSVDDYDFTRALAHAVRQSVHALVPGSYEIEAQGKYPPGTNVDRAGRELVFGLAIYTPVLDQLLPYAPSDVHANISDGMTLPTGQNEAGCEAP